MVQCSAKVCKQYYRSITMQLRDNKVHSCQNQKRQK